MAADVERIDRILRRQIGVRIALERQRNCSGKRAAAVREVVAGGIPEFVFRPAVIARVKENRSARPAALRVVPHDPRIHQSDRISAAYIGVHRGVEGGIKARMLAYDAPQLARDRFHARDCIAADAGRESNLVVGPS